MKKIYKNLNELPIIRFYEIMKTNNLRFLFKEDFYECKDIELTKEDEKELNNVWQEFVYQLENVDAEIDVLVFKISAYNFLYNTKQNITYKNKLELTKKLLEKALQEKNTGSTNKNFSLQENIIILEQYFKLNLDMFTLPTNKYFNYLKIYNIQSEKIKENNKKSNG